jgi:hypothetical protein
MSPTSSPMTVTAATAQIHTVLQMPLRGPDAETAIAAAIRTLKNALVASGQYEEAAAFHESLRIAGTIQTQEACRRRRKEWRDRGIGVVLGLGLLLLLTLLLSG